MKVVDPRGQTWRVSRRWVPWRRRVRHLDSGPDLPSVDLGDDPISAIIGVVLLVLLLPVLLLALLASLEFLLLLVVLPFAVLSRVLLGRRWTVEARRGWTPYYEEPAGDWAGSRAVIGDLAEAIRQGRTPPQTLGEGARPGAKRS